jgi:thiamine biosynthesis lipoprotein
VKQHDFVAMGTDWSILGEGLALDAMERAEALVRNIEARLSRFLPDSALSRLNRERQMRDAQLAKLLRVAMRFRQTTLGAFDPTLGSQLATLGYDRTYSAVCAPVVDQRSAIAADFRVVIDGQHVSLEGSGEVDLGGIAKGWTVDRVVAQLRATGAESVLVDGGGDIGVHGAAWPIGVGEDLSVTLRDGAVATSSTLRRRWLSAQGDTLHHVLSPRTGLPSESSVDTVTVVARDATTADALATALLADPWTQVPRLAEHACEAALRVASGVWYTTAGWSEAP